MKKELNLIFLFMLLSSITATITGDPVVIHSNVYEKYDGEVDAVVHSNGYEKYDGEVDNIIHPNAQAKYDGLHRAIHPNAQEKFDGEVDVVVRSNEYEKYDGEVDTVVQSNEYEKYDDDVDGVIHPNAQAKYDDPHRAIHSNAQKKFDSEVDAVVRSNEYEKYDGEVDAVVHSNEYEKHDGEVDGMIHPNAQAKYDSPHRAIHPNAQEKYDSQVDVVVHSNEYEKFDDEVDGVIHPNAHAKYDGHPNAQEKYAVEPLFFREKMLKEGVVMQMPDIKDKLPKRSFLPRSILAKLPPFSTSNMVALKGFFKVSDNSRTEKRMRDSIRECERAPARGESKRCVRSMQEMVDFATSILGHNVVVHTTQNVNGSSKYVMIGRIHRINGGNVTQSVTCHQHMFPYVLLYFCHYVPMVRIYQADLLDPKSNDKINQAIAVCHLDTSSWSRANRAFVELGSGPGRIEACHWVFENDMSWTIVD